MHSDNGDEIGAEVFMPTKTPSRHSVPANLVAGSWSGPLTAPAKIPAACDVVIIGGGIVGVSTAWFLARQGIDVVLCEKGYIAGEQSGRNWGWVRQQGRDAREMPMMLESMAIWRTLQQDINEEVGFRQTGCLYAARDEAELASYASWMATARHYGLDTKLLSAGEMGQYTGDASVKWQGGIYTPSDGRAEPHLAAPAIARAAAAAGATLLTACAVRGLETTAGSVSGVVTEFGTIKASQVLCAGGAWTSQFCRSLGINVPQLKARGTVLRTAPCEQVLDGTLWDDLTGLRRRLDGGYTVATNAYMDHSITPASFHHGLKFLLALKQEFSNLRLSLGREFFEQWLTPKRWPLDQPSPFEKTRVLNPAPNPRAVALIRRELAALYPQLADVEIAETWAGIIETSPDLIPIMEQSESIAGFYIATGFSAHGFGLGPGAGKAMAGLISGKDNSIDLHEFRLSRFYDGSKIELQRQI